MVSATAGAGVSTKAGAVAGRADVGAGVSILSWADCCTGSDNPELAVLKKVSPGLETGSLVKWITRMVVGSGGTAVVLTVGSVGATVVSVVWAAGSSNAGAGAGARPSNAGGGAGASTSTLVTALFSVRSMIRSLCTGTNSPCKAL